jgi:RNA polymerase sigma-70 factor (ECF subfamily)
LQLSRRVTHARLAGPWRAVATPSPSSAVEAQGSARSGDAALVAALRRGDEAAFVALVTRHQASLRRIARMYVPTDAIADEVVQETWLAVVGGLGRFEGRSSLKTWIFHILANRAKTRGERERRYVPFSALGGRDEGDDGPSADADRFRPEGEAWAGHWAIPPCPWEDPERRLGSIEARAFLRDAINALPPVQQAVLALRDVEGLPAEEVCELLDLTAGNQRVLLHRARSRLRAALEDYMEC